MLRLIGILLLLAIAALIGAFAMQNTTPVALDLFIAQIEQAPLGVVVIAAFMTGGIVGLLAGSGVWFRLKRRERLANKQLAQSTKELESLRSNVA